MFVFFDMFFVLCIRCYGEFYPSLRSVYASRKRRERKSPGRREKMQKGGEKYLKTCR